MRCFSLRKILAEIVKDPVQFRESIIPCGCVILLLTAFLAALLFPFISRLVRFGQ